MSYILDALRKADAQRERDASRGIHANPAPLGPSGDGASAKSRGMWAAVVVGIAVVVGAGAFFMRGSSPAVPTAVSTAVNTPAPAPKVIAPADLPPAVPVKMQPPQAVANAIVPAAPPPAAAVVRATPQMNLAPGAAMPGLSADERSRQAREAAFSDPSRMPGGTSGPRPIPSTKVAQDAPQVQPQSQPQAAAAPAPAAAGLPPDAPKVSISGGVYSSSPAQRMLIVNGQVFNEGSEVAPGLAIEKIEPRTATLTFRGARYVVAY